MIALKLYKTDALPNLIACDHARSDRALPACILTGKKFVMLATQSCAETTERAQRILHKALT
jgi:hypothetical protein